MRIFWAEEPNVLIIDKTSCPIPKLWIKELTPIQSVSPSNGAHQLQK